MKTSKKILSLVLAFVMAFSCAVVAFAAQSFDGEYTEDMTILAGAEIKDTAVFKGKVTIDSKATVSAGTFNGTVVNNGKITGGTFKNTVTNNGLISDGTFKGAVNNNAGKFVIALSAGISGGTFDGTVVNNSPAIIAGGTFNGSVSNKSGASVSAALAIPPVFNGEVTNEGTVSNGTFNNKVTNTGTISAGSFCNVVANNGGTVKSSVSAIVATKNGDNTEYNVQGIPAIKGKVTIGGKNTTFSIKSSSILTVTDGAELTLNCPCTINGKISVNEGGKLTSTSGSLNGESGGDIYVSLGASFGGAAASKFDYITYKEHNITVESNIDMSQFTFTVADSAYKSTKVNYAFDFSGTVNDCLVLNSIKVYKNRKSDSNVIHASSDILDSFEMPDEDVIIYIDCVANHTVATEHKDASCLTDGYDRTYCSKCTHQLSYTKIPAKGHSYSEWKYASDDETVLKTRTCSSCGNVDKAYIEIVNEKNGRELKVDYKSTMTFHANVKYEGAYKLYWKYTSGGKTSTVEDNGSKSFTVTNAEDDFTIKAYVVSELFSSETQNITVKHGFFDKIKAFFRGLFKKLPVYIDNVKQ